MINLNKNTRSFLYQVTFQVLACFGNMAKEQGRQNGNRFVVDEDDFIFGDCENKCCSSYDFQDSDQEEEKEYMLQNELTNNRFFSRAWEKAEKLNKKSKILSHYELLSVITYTLEKPNVYQEFNEQTREFKNPPFDESFQFKGMHYFLHSAINKLAADDGPFHVYRGVTHKVDAKLGQDFYFQSFVSASTDLDIAKKFGTTYRPTFNGEFHGDIITVFDISKTFKGADIEEFSQFAESEVLIPPCEAFKVVGITNKIEEWIIDEKERRLKTTFIHLESQSSKEESSDSDKDTSCDEDEDD